MGRMKDLLIEIEEALPKVEWEEADDPDFETAGARGWQGRAGDFRFTVATWTAENGERGYDGAVGVHRKQATVMHLPPNLAKRAVRMAEEQE